MFLLPLCGNPSERGCGRGLLSVSLKELSLLHLPGLADGHHGGEMKAGFMLSLFQSLSSEHLSKYFRWDGARKGPSVSSSFPGLTPL